MVTYFLQLQSVHDKHVLTNHNVQSSADEAGDLDVQVHMQHNAGCESQRSPSSLCKRQAEYVRTISDFPV